MSLLYNNLEVTILRNKNEEITTKFATFFHSLAYFSDPEVISEMSDRNLENDTIDELKELIELIKNQSDNNNL